MNIDDMRLQAHSHFVTVQTCLQSLEVAADHMDSHMDQITMAMLAVKNELNAGKTTLCTQHYQLSAGSDEGGEDLWLSNNEGEGLVMPVAALDTLLDQHFKGHF